MSSLSYDSIFSMKYEIRSSPQSAGTLRETKVSVGKLTYWRNVVVLVN